MKVYMTAAISGARDGAPWPAIGGAIDVPKPEADDLINLGFASTEAPAKAKDAPKVEKATAPKPEKRA